jgi:Asp-tRNA(Asn)/Glu-tRNA(Gln) amidotransferase A subunit family amidase
LQFDMKNIKFYYIEQLDGLFVSKTTLEVRLAHLKFLNFIEQACGTRVTHLDGNGLFFKQAATIWLRLANVFLANSQRTQIAELMSGRASSSNDDEEQDLLNQYQPHQVTVISPFGELVKSLLGMSEHTLPTIGLSLLEKLTCASTDKPESLLAELKLIRNDLETILGDDGVLIVPSFPTTAPFHNQSLWTNPIDSACYLGFVNALGLPSTQVPLELTRTDTLPVGVQLVASRYCDKLPIKLAQFIEKEIGGWLEP